MVGELAIRFLLGGGVVSLFAVVGELFEPKTFAGIFGAAPSVALGSLGLTALWKGSAEVGAQSHAMIFGAIAFVAYGALLAVVVRRWRLPAWLEAGLAWSVWGAVAIGAWALFLRDA